MSMSMSTTYTATAVIGLGIPTRAIVSDGVISPVFRVALIPFTGPKKGRAFTPGVSIGYQQEYLGLLWAGYPTIDGVSVIPIHQVGTDDQSRDTSLAIEALEICYQSEHLRKTFSPLGLWDPAMFKLWAICDNY